MDAQEKTLALLARYKCEPVRSKNHNIYRLPSGKHYTMPQTASDHHAWDNCLSQLKVALGISKRGKVAKVRTASIKKKPPKKITSKPVELLAPAPIGFNFGEKIRAALKGERPTHPEVITLPLQKESTEQHRFRKAPRQGKQHERHGVVRVWSRDEIESANIALRSGKLNEFMQHYDQASLPEVATTTHQPPKEATTMLTPEQIDQTIHELDAGMAAAMELTKTEETKIHNWETEITQARERVAAASDKYNSLNDVKTSLSVLKGDVEKVRPMLGLLAHDKPGRPLHYVKRSGMKVGEAIRHVLDRADSPMRAGDIHKAITSIHGCEGIAKASIYTFLSSDLKNNGSAIVSRIGEQGYWPAGKPLPQQVEVV